MTLLQLIKSHESAESLILILDDLEAKKVMEAWTLYDVSHVVAARIDRKRKGRESLRDALDEVWGKSEVEFSKLATIAGLPYQIVAEKFARLKAARLIYPDCTIPDEARRLLRSEVNAYRAGLWPRGMRPPVPPTPPTRT